MSVDRFSLVDRMRRARELIPESHQVDLQPGEVFRNHEDVQKRLQDFAFCNGFAVVQTNKEVKNRIRITYKCHRHGKKTKNWRKTDEKDRKRPNTHERNIECPFLIYVRCKAKTADVWTYSVANDEHNHPMLEDPFCLPEHYARDPDREETLAQASDLRGAHQTYSNVIRVLACKGFRLSNKNAYYNLLKSEGKKSPSQEAALALHHLDEAGWHVRYDPVRQLENNELQYVEFRSFFFCSDQQISMARKFASSFVVITDATFNTNTNRLPLSVLVAVTNVSTSFPIAYCYVQSESEDAFLFMFECMRDLFFHDRCRGPKVVLADMAKGLRAAFVRPFDLLTQQNKSKFVFDAAGSDDTQLQWCTWHVAEAIKKHLTKKGYPAEEKTELHSLVWNWIKSATVSEAETNLDKLRSRLREDEQAYLRENYEIWASRFVHAFTKLQANLGSSASQRGESLHPWVKSLVNRHSPMSWSVQKVMQSVDELYRIYTDKIAEQKKDLPRLIHPNRHFFSEVMSDVTHECLLLVLPELVAAKGLYTGVSNGAIPEDEAWGSACVAECPLPLRYGLPCRCWLYRCVKNEGKIPASLIHPRWRFDAPELNSKWRMSFNRRRRRTYVSVDIESNAGDDDDDSDVTEIAPFAPSVSGNRYEDHGKVLYESTFLRTHAHAQEIPKAHKKEDYHKYMADGLKALDEKWRTRNDNTGLTPRFGEGPTNRNLKFKKGQARAMTGREEADEAVRLERRRLRAASIEQHRVQSHQRLWELQEQHHNSEFSQRNFDDDEPVGHGDVDPGQILHLAEVSHTENVDPIGASDDESDLEYLGEKRARHRSESLSDIEELTQPWKPGAKKPFMPPPASQKTQTSQFFAGNVVPDPTPLASLSQTKDVDTELPRATRTSRGQPRKKTEAQRDADREKKAQEQRRQKDKEVKQRRADKRKKRLMEPREEPVSQLREDLEQLMSSP